MKILITLFPLFLFSSFQDFYKKKNDCGYDSLTGKVKQIEQHYYEAKKTGDKIVPGAKVDNTYENYLVTYNEQGNYIERKNFQVNGSIESKQTFKYDTKGNRIEWNWYKADSSLDRRYGFKNDENGNKIEMTSYNLDGTIFSQDTFIYHEKEKTIESYTSYTAKENTFILNGNDLITKYYNKFDDKGNMTEWKSSNNDGSIINKYVYKYDDKGNRIEENEYKADGSSYLKSKNTYDSKGNMIGKSEYAPDGNLLRKTTYKYDYDTTGNWTNKIEIINDTPKYISTRQISYY